MLIRPEGGIALGSLLLLLLLLLTWLRMEIERRKRSKGKGDRRIIPSQRVPTLKSPWERWVSLQLGFLEWDDGNL